MWHSRPRLCWRGLRASEDTAEGGCATQTMTRHSCILAHVAAHIHTRRHLPSSISRIRSGRVRSCPKTRVSSRRDAILDALRPEHSTRSVEDVRSHGGPWERGSGRASSVMRQPLECTGSTPPLTGRGASASHDPHTRRHFPSSISFAT